MPDLTIEELEKVQECLEDYVSLLEDDPNFNIDDTVFEKHEKAKESLILIEDLMG